MRLFSALPLPPPCVDRLASFRLRWASARDGLRWSTPEQWHITLRFFGDVPEEQARCLNDELLRLRAQAPTLTLDGLDLFAAKGILVAAIQTSAPLLELHARVMACGEACGITLESRPFRPHVTLARSKCRTGDATLRTMKNPGLPVLGPELQWTAEECLLLESHMRAHGAEYSIRARVALGKTD